MEVKSKLSRISFFAGLDLEETNNHIRYKVIRSVNFTLALNTIEAIILLPNDFKIIYIGCLQLNHLYIRF